MVNDDAVSRAAGKLDAGIAAFALAPRIGGALAIDIGASTGGFTETLLKYGAARVVAVDVGRDQLHARLRADPRVESLEGVDWKTLALDVAPGPFDFFSIDVSFVAARNMLRGLAFRLRDGAEGVVLIKPQFELPAQKTTDHTVADPNLRRLAVEKFTERAVALGFVVDKVIDSPVAGREGTVEMLAHVRFLGRSDKLPRLGEKRRTTDGKTKTAVPIGSVRAFAVVPPGLEPVCAAELQALGLAARIEAGGVEVEATPRDVVRMNLWSRVATRILVRVGEFDAENFVDLRRRSAKLPWDRYVGPATLLKFSTETHRCRLYHTGAIEENLRLAIADRVGKPGEPSGSEQRLVVRGVENRFTVSVDSSGELLHRRGWRTEVAEAPLRETLAAAILRLAAYDPTRPLVDLLCGTGAFVFEAAAIQRGLAPGGARSFACVDWPGFVAADEVAAVQREAASAVSSTGIAPIVGYDRDPKVIASAERNRERFPIVDAVRFEVASFDKVVPPVGEPGLLVANPPYGKRLGDEKSAERLYHHLGKRLRQWRGWRVAILVPPRLSRALSLDSVSKHRLQNGGLKLDLHLIQIR